MKTSVLDLKGNPIVLTPQEVARCNALQRKFRAEELHNALGFEINITTLTAISKSVVEQKFFTIPPAEYMPVRVGENSWSTEITTYRDFQLGGDFESGIINTGASNSRLAEADAGVDSVTNPVINWAKQIGWSLFDLKFAAKSGNWDLVTSKERARKRNWDLGIQKIAFLGSSGNPNVMGLLTQSGVNSNTSLITGYIKSMNATQYSTFVAGIVEAYRANCNRTAMPTHFIIPEADYNGLATLIPGTVGTYPVPMLTYLLEAFKMITMNPNFKILPCAYADEANNATVTGLNKNRYTLLNYDEDSYRMDIPVDYSNTLQNTINGFQFQNVGYGQFTGGLAYRPLEMLYFDFT
ncbi:MAG: DUF2184 domain-containing protein [Acidobacteriia bacterium]|nr:DUF2184 domain-containing protein [Terriglobia bacterium]